MAWDWSAYTTCRSMSTTSIPRSLSTSTVLGLKVRPDRPDFSFGGAWLDAGGQQVHLIEAATPENLGQHFALAFTDLAGLVAGLRESGLEVTEPVRSGTSLQSFVNDPAGNRVELHQPGAFATRPS